MNKTEVLNMFTEYAKEHRKDVQSSITRNNHMNDIQPTEIIQQRVIDAILVDFINYVGIKQGIDYGLYTLDIE